MHFHAAQKPLTDPDELLAIVDLRALGWMDRKIMKVLKISRATWFRRLAELRAIEAAGPPEPEPDDD